MPQIQGYNIGSPTGQIQEVTLTTSGTKHFLDIGGAISTVAVADNPEVFEDTSFVAGDSPAILDVNTVLGRNGTQFNVLNDGVGNFTVATSTDGAVFGGEHTLKNGESYSIDNISVDSIRITRVADSAYRVTVL